MGDTERRDLPALTGLRFFLALGVVVFHYTLGAEWRSDPPTGIVERARLGVDVFFVLSGFVLAHVYGRALAENTFDYPRFLLARLARIWPAHVVILAGMAVLAALAALMGEALDPVKYGPEGFLSTLTMTHAWFPRADPTEWNGPSWSLSAEWFAYLLFPLTGALAVALRKRPLVLLGVAVGLFAAFDAFYRGLFGETVTHAEFNLGILRILPEFIAGMALCGLSERWRLAPGAATLTAGASIVGLIAVMHLSAPEAAIIAMAGLMILALAVASKAGRDGVLGSAPLVALGEASYGLYLLHFPMVVVWKNAMAKLAGGDSGYAMQGWEVVTLTSAAVVASLLMHRWIERPARGLVRRLGERLLPARTVAG